MNEETKKKLAEMLEKRFNQLPLDGKLAELNRKLHRQLTTPTG